MESHPSLIDAMRDLEVERLRFQAQGERARVIAARRDEPWKPAADLLPDCKSLLALYEDPFLAGGHERLDVVFRDGVGLRFLCAVHSSRAGPGAGGLRRHDLVDPEETVVRDVLNLARAMTYKNLAAETGRGGSKLCIHNPPLPPYDRDAWLEALVEEIDLSGTITGPDTGLTGADMIDLAARTDNVSGILGGGTSVSAAFGVHEAIKATAAALGRPLNETHVAIQGLGSLGLELATQLAGDGAKLTVTDQDHGRIDALLSGLTPAERKLVGIVAPYQITEVEADILAPCAAGDVITADGIAGLNCRAICGGANNQLRAANLDDELALAERLHLAGILFVPDWLASAGGAIHGVMEATKGETFETKKARARIRRVSGWAVDAVLEDAKRTGRTPLHIAAERYLGSLSPASGNAGQGS